MQNKEICWNITAKCNQQCKYCHRFLNIDELSFEENKKILKDLINIGIEEITWTGGEALLLNYVDELIKIAYNNGIKNKLITNGKLLTENRMKNIFPYLDSITLSIDSIDDNINDKLGRGKDHFTRINSILTYIQNNSIDIKVRINTVINKYNLNAIEDLINYLNNFEIYSWRIFKFMPLREKAALMQKHFEISDEKFIKIKSLIIKESNNNRIEFRVNDDMETRYILILADGSIVVTENRVDKTIGNILLDINKINCL